MNQDDLQRISCNNGWVNDNILWYTFLTSPFFCNGDINNDCIVIDSYFYSSVYYDLFAKGVVDWAQQGALKLKRRFKRGGDMFAKKLMIFPINYRRSHWALAVVTNLSWFVEVSCP